MKASQVSRSPAVTIGPLQIGIILLTLATAGIHLSLLFPDTLFILNAIGYVTLLLAYFLPIPFLRQNHNLIRWAFIGFTAVTIIAWLIMGQKTLPENALGYVCKAIEVVLIGLLLADSRR
jgi:hypothetical protein